MNVQLVINNKSPSRSTGRAYIYFYLLLSKEYSPKYFCSASFSIITYLTKYVKLEKSGAGEKNMKKAPTIAGAF